MGHGKLEVPTGVVCIWRMDSRWGEYASSVGARSLAQNVDSECPFDRIASLVCKLKGGRREGAGRMGSDLFTRMCSGGGLTFTVLAVKFILRT